MKKDETIKLTELNKKILEIKKKIQLSEGQRRALFEDCEAERKLNADEILKLKKEISNLVIVLHKSKSSSAKYRLENSLLQQIVGPLNEKTCSEIKDMLDLQIIDLSKKLDVLVYKIKNRKIYIIKLGEEYEKLISKREKKELAIKVDIPVGTSSRELQNNIHAVEVQIREALHIRHKYTSIRRSLKDDAANFQSKIKTLEEEMQVQAADIEKLQQIMQEATKRRAKARGNLLKEERHASSAANRREHEASEGRRLVSERKNELEKLEKRLFISGKIPVRPEPEGAEAEGEEDKSPTPSHPVECKAQEFELLKKVTGGTSTKEVLNRFENQKNTYNKLNELRIKLEDEKSSIENSIESLKTQLEGYKYSETTNVERKSSETERLQCEIAREQSKSENFKRKKTSIENALTGILRNLHSLRLLANPLAIPEDKPIRMLQQTSNDIKLSVEKHDKLKATDIPEEEPEQIEVVEHQLPTPYSGLIRRTPQPQMTGSPIPGPPPGSEDEEEVPSRHFLKRQAQLVIEAKSRRKNLRVQLPKRN
ncbi:hypothetical protein ABEB36_005642 [Hypothenemus hampei]|uniref:Uncharacterized protein n=1 Tax=Hypothenemus hampei TaxID=57062 RepID=A0ABD1EYX9_HYPHA